jgi:ubiquinone/menaquinone biosynthesis C-methylase UbiE
MWRWLTPRRRRGVEVLDLPSTSDAVRLAAMRDLERSNRWFGGRTAVMRALRRALTGFPPNRPVTFLDVGTGTGDIAAGARALLRTSRPGSTTIGLDASPALLGEARRRVDVVVSGDARSLPFRAMSADVVTCSQLLHHFTDDEARLVLAELHRVSRGVVVLADLRRSWLAAAGFFVASLLLRFHPVTRRDGVTSVLRGFTSRELRELVRSATGVAPRVQRSRFWRLTATWDARLGSISAP